MNAVKNFSQASGFPRGRSLQGVISFFLASTVPLLAEIKLPPAATRTVDYLQDIKPLLAKNCYECHGVEKQQAGLRLDLRQNALRGGDYGPVIVPGKSAESKLIHKTVDGDGGDQMPPDGELTEAEIGLLRAWIDQGADFRNDVMGEAPPIPIDPKLAALIDAVRSAPRATAEKLLKANPDLLNAQDPAKSTLLHHAAGFGTLETLKWLVESGADVNAKNRRGSTPLHWAIHDEAKVRLLLARGAGVNTKQAEGRTPLYLAAMLGNGHSILRLLLENGADPNLKTANGRTPLMVAAGRGDVEALRLLIDAKAVVNAKDSAGETALMVAASLGRPPAVRLLLERGADARVETKRSETALGNAGTSGNEEVVRLLLDHGADVNTRNIRGYSPLMLAASSDTIPSGAVKLLLARGADVSCKGDYDETARDLAAKRGYTEVTRLLGGAPSEKSAPAAVAQRTQGQRRNSIPEAVERALVMTEKQSYTFIRVGGCNSCHSQDLPSAAAAFARSRGLSAPREIPQLPASMMPSPERVMDLDFVVVAGKAWELFDSGMNGVPRNAYTDAVVRLIKALQEPEGYWPASESRRPPMPVGGYQAAALSIYAIKHYGPVGEEATSAQAVSRAVAWLKRAKPVMTQDRAFHLLGLAWGGATPDTEAVRALTAMQRSDGGWSQLAEMESDAYATGQALYALNAAARMSATNPVYQKGVDYLLRTQAEDGTWHVKTRAIWLQPYFESGFPYAKDQFISTAGTAWAAMALAAAQTPALAQR
jgi:ankyrin repeat protein/mono/diheme cytochrome c family protein